MNFDERYGWAARLLHRVAFQGGLAQRTLADVEEALYADALDAISVTDPVFISSLPRAGTTILLRLLWKTGRFATHTYRDMPFVLCPMIWRRFSSQFAADHTTHERAHGDGIEISRDSPESFEEMIWKHFWPDHYGENQIRPWQSGDQNPEFDAFFETHMQKVLALHWAERTNGKDAPSLRYVSKNNLNISRLGARPPSLRSGTLLIPFRTPVQQAASMHKQHQRFLELHAEDSFVREYMEAIGHHEFGKGLKPVNFNNWLDDASATPDTLAFWLRYWTAAYRFIAEQTDETDVLVSYARLTNDPEAALTDLAETLGMESAPLTDQANDLRPPRTHEADTDDVPVSLLQKAETLYKRLQQRSAV